jgi:hypothetical protein
MSLCGMEFSFVHKRGGSMASEAPEKSLENVWNVKIELGLVYILQILCYTY